jgi:uncharacterized protein YecE (DUF72 family)
MHNFWVGTSGWNYGDWKGKFYPEDLPARRWLSFYAKKFPTVEVNYSFYHLPRPSTFENWSKSVPDDFIFALKASRVITHLKRLHNVSQELRNFLDNAQALGLKLGPILFQFPPSFRVNSAVLQKFLKLKEKNQRWAFEFRHSSWFVKEIYRVLEKYNVALVIADSPRYPLVKQLTADFTYLRFHGSPVMFVSKYSHQELKGWARVIRKWLKDIDVYAYFNNDVQAAAVKNAFSLQTLLKK